jgi:hypothetical protein
MTSLRIIHHIVAEGAQHSAAMTHTDSQKGTAA